MDYSTWNLWFILLIVWFSRKMHKIEIYFFVINTIKRLVVLVWNGTSINVTIIIPFCIHRIVERWDSTIQFVHMWSGCCDESVTKLHPDNPRTTVALSAPPGVIHKAHERAAHVTQDSSPITMIPTMGQGSISTFIIYLIILWTEYQFTAYCMIFWKHLRVYRLYIGSGPAYLVSRLRYNLHIFARKYGPPKVFHWEIYSVAVIWIVIVFVFE